MHLKEELEKRGLINQYSDEKLFELYEKWWENFYCWFDPTADSLHLWNFVLFMNAINFMKKWNKFYLILWGATWMIWDPGWKDSERTFLSEETIQHNLESIHKQVSKILKNLEKMSGFKFDFEIINNADFYKNMNFLKFLREVGKFITVNSMMTKETVKKRIEDPDKSISYTEFSYMLIQWYDFLKLYKDFDVKLQICGSDQRWNWVTWIELIRKKLDKEAYVFTTPLLLASNWKKFWKSEWNAIWLDENKNSPYFVYQYFMNSADQDIERYLKVFSLLSFEEINNIVQKHFEKPELRYWQQQLANYVVSMIFGEDKAKQAKKISDLLFGQWDKIKILQDLNDEDKIAVINELNNKNHYKFDNNKNWILDILVQTWLTNSKWEARKLIKQWWLYLNEEKINDENSQIQTENFINWLILLRKWKKTYKILEK